MLINYDDFIKNKVFGNYVERPPSVMALEVSECIELLTVNGNILHIDIGDYIVKRDNNIFIMSHSTFLNKYQVCTPGVIDIFDKTQVTK